MNRKEIASKLDEIIPELRNISNASDFSTKMDICNAIYIKSGLKDYTLFEFILEVLRISGMGSKDSIKVSLPDIEEVKGLDESHGVDDLIDSFGLSWYNVHSCLDSISGNKIPVLVGLAGAGKTYTENNMSSIIWRYVKDIGRGDFKSMYKVLIPCSNISHNDFWGSFDAVSHTCVGKFKYIYQEALKNPDTLYYVILDEMLDMYDIRKTFGDGFSKIPNLPDNIIVVATGNRDVFDSSNETARNMMRDSGILGRFDLIEVNNILMNIDSAEYIRFFDSIETTTTLESKLKNLVLYYDKITDDKMLVPRNVINFIHRGRQSIPDSDYFNLLCNYISLDDKYLIKALFADIPKLSRANVDKFEEIWNEL